MKKKNNIWIYSLMIMSFLLVLTYGCKKDEEPEPTPEPTPAPTTVTDVDGNVYHTVKIGTQTWMVENLKVTHYRNGDPIQHFTNVAQWDNLTTGAWVNYDNLSQNIDPYGHLYNWYALVDGPLIAPAGWHIPTDAEWQILSDYLGGNAVAGGKLKETGTTHWTTPNTDATNETGFTALPGGVIGQGNFNYGGVLGIYWSSSETGMNEAAVWGLEYLAGYFYRSEYAKCTGASVRCIKD